MVAMQKSSFLKNTLYIVLSSLSFNFVLLLFWMVAAELYPKEQVGVAASVLSSLFLIELFSRMGLDYSIIRFFPEGDKCRIFNTSIVLAPLLALLLSIVYVGKQYLIDMEPAEPFGTEIRFIYIFTPFVLSFLVMIGTSFRAIHKAELNLFQTILRGLCVLFLLFFLPLGTGGIIGAFFASSLLVLLISIPIAKRSGFRFFLKPDVDFLKKTFKLSMGNYLAIFLSLSLYLIMPIMVMYMLGATDTAYFIVVFNICSILFKIPSSIGESLFIEGSGKRELKGLVFKTVKIVMATLIILSTLLYFASYPLLDLVGRDKFGENYLYGLDLFRMFIFSSFFVAFSSIYLAVKMIQKDVKNLIIMSGLITLMTTISCYVFMQHFGFLGLGYGWLAGQGLSFALISILVFREFRSGPRNLLFLDLSGPE